MPEYERYFTVKTPEDIRNDAMDNLVSDLDKREGTFANDMASPLALELHKMYEALRRIRPMVWVEETSGPFLDLAAEDLGIEPRKPGARAVVALAVTGTAGTRLPAGSAFLTGEGLLFDTDADMVIPESGTASVTATAREIGDRGNVDAGTVVHRYSGDTRIGSVTNPAPAQGGADPETDKSLYERIVFARQRPATSGNRYHYEMWAREVDGVGTVRVFPLWNGNGTVKVLIADEERQPVDDATVERCAAHIEEMRPTTARVTVVSAIPRQVDISVHIQTREEQNAPQRALLLESIRQQLERHFREMSLEEFRVSYHWVGSMLLHTEGVFDYEKLRLNGQRADVPLTVEQIPVLGEVDVQWI